VCEEVGSYEWLGDVGDYETPCEIPAQSQIETERHATKMAKENYLRVQQQFLDKISEIEKEEAATEKKVAAVQRKLAAELKKRISYGRKKKRCKHA
jgi:hypothetical protein